MTQPEQERETLETALRIRYPDEPERIVRGRIETPADWRRGDAPLPYCLIVHGFQGWMDQGLFPRLSRRLAQAGICAVRFNFSGTGIGDDLESFSEPELFARDTYSRELDELERVRAHVASPSFGWIDPTRGALVGHSRGGGLVLIHAAEAGDYRAVVTWASIERAASYGEESQRRWREEGHLQVFDPRTGEEHRLLPDVLHDAQANRARFDLPAACARTRTPTLLVHGGSDRAVPVDAHGRLLEAFPEGVARGLVLDGVAHTFGEAPYGGADPGSLERGLTATVDWIRQHTAAD